MLSLPCTTLKFLILTSTDLFLSPLLIFFCFPCDTLTYYLEFIQKLQGLTTLSYFLNLCYTATYLISWQATLHLSFLFLGPFSSYGVACSVSIWRLWPCQIVSCFIMSGCSFLEACFFSEEKQWGSVSRREGSWEKLQSGKGG